MDELFPLLVILLVVVAPTWIAFHYITIWRKQKTLQPDDERMLEDLWRSARAMERRIESLEAIIDGEVERTSSRSDNLRDDIYRKN